MVKKVIHLALIYRFLNPSYSDLILWLQNLISNYTLKKNSDLNTSFNSIIIFIRRPSSSRHPRILHRRRHHLSSPASIPSLLSVNVICSFTCRPSSVLPIALRPSSPLGRHRLLHLHSPSSFFPARPSAIQP